MFEVVDGDIFESGADIIVNPVNCEGVSGKGLAKEFARRFPENQRYYEEACTRGTLLPGTLLVFDRIDQTPCRILNAATKEAWWDPSSLIWIDQLATDIAKHLMGHPVDSIAIPALGCGIGTGGMPWIVVKTLIERRLQHVADCRVQLFRPHEIAESDQAYPFADISDQYPQRCLHAKVRPSTDFTLPDLINFGREDDSQKPYERKLGCYHPSGISRRECDRAIAYERLGTPPRRKKGLKGLNALFDIGHAVHDAIQQRLGRIRGSHGQRFESEVEISYAPLRIYGHADGVFGDWVVEIKTVGKATFASISKPMKEHILQVTCYMLALDIPRAIILYVCRDNGKMMEFRVHFKEEHLLTLVDTIDHIEGFIAQEELPPGNPDYWRCVKCKYEHICQPKVKKPKRGK